MPLAANHNGFVAQDLASEPENSMPLAANHNGFAAQDLASEPEIVCD